MTAMTNHTASGTRAKAVTRWAHQCSTPSLAEPRPIARPSGERSRVAAMSVAPLRERGEPGENRQRRGCRDDGPAAGVNAAQLKPVSAVPPQMPDPVAQMVEQGG